MRYRVKHVRIRKHFPNGASRNVFRWVAERRVEFLFLKWWWPVDTEFYTTIEAAEHAAKLDAEGRNVELKKPLELDL